MQAKKAVIGMILKTEKKGQLPISGEVPEENPAQRTRLACLLNAVSPGQRKQSFGSQTKF